MCESVRGWSADGGGFCAALGGKSSPSTHTQIRDVSHCYVSLSQPTKDIQAQNVSSLSGVTELHSLVPPGRAGGTLTGNKNLSEKVRRVH